MTKSAKRMLKLRRESYQNHENQITSFNTKKSVWNFQTGIVRSDDKPKLSRVKTTNLKQ